VAELIRTLVEGRCELGLAYAAEALAGDHTTGEGEHATLVVRRIGHHDVWVLLPPETDVPDPVPLAALDGRVVIDSMTGFGAVRTTVREAMRAAGVRMRSGVRTRHLEALAPLVLAGAGVAFTSPGYAREAARTGVVARRLEPRIGCDFALLHRSAALSPAARGFVGVLLAELGVEGIHGLADIQI
jgi:DNA-binding transcriptional LysR family regulator